MGSPKEIQDLMKTLYFSRDKEIDQLGTFNWLKEEIREWGGGSSGK